MFSAKMVLEASFFPVSNFEGLEDNKVELLESTLEFLSSLRYTKLLEILVFRFYLSATQ